MPNNILIIGNGFDLYHKLPTRYSDFMFLASEWIGFYRPYCDSCNKKGPMEQITVPLTDKGEMTQEALTEFGKHGYLMNKNHIDFLNKHLPTNTWIKCFQRKMDQGNRWVDFEAEIQNVLYDTEEYSMISIPKNAGKPATYGLPDRLTRIADIFGDAARNRYLNFGEIIVSETDADKAELQENKQHLIQFMIDELNNLIKCLQYYLKDFVGNIKCEYYSEEVKQLGEVDLLNFNYTTTFSTIYKDGNLHEQHAVHGGIANGDIVLGISDEAFPDTYDYIRFQKYFQRIQKKTGSYYEKWFGQAEEDGRFLPKHVYVFGHSLGLADFGVLRSFFANTNVEDITIYYHNPSSYEELVINLVKALEKEKAIEMIGNEKIKFKELKPACKIIVAKTTSLT